MGYSNGTIVANRINNKLKIMEMKQSSVERKAFKSSLDYLLYYLPSAIRGQFKEQIEQAKAMHKEEIKEAVKYGCSDWGSAKDSEQYYNETYGGQDEH